MEALGKRTDVDDEEEEIKNFDKLCELCELDSVKTQETGLCIDCDQYMCNACFRQHIKAESFRHHTLLDINASSETCLMRHTRDATECNQHDGEVIKFYCRKHEAVGCGHCMVLGHYACKSETIKDVSDNYQQNDEYKTFMRQIEKLISERKESEKKIQENKHDNKLMLEKALGDINQFRLHINKYLDKVETDITRQVKNVMDENETLLTKLENNCTMLSTELEEITNMLNSELFKDNVLFIHMVECKPKLSESQMAMSNMKSKSMKKYEFVCDQQLRSLVTSAQKFGTLTISTSAVFSQTTESVNEKEMPVKEENGEKVGRDIDTDFKDGSGNDNDPDLSELAYIEDIRYMYEEFIVIRTYHWEDCLGMTDKVRQIEKANELLEMRIIPDQLQVHLSCSVFGRRSETFRRIGSLISEYIRSKSDDVVDVWAAYRYYENSQDEEIKPVFVVITKKGKAGINENDFDIIVRDETVFSIESERVLAEVEKDLSKEIKFPESKLTDIDNCVSRCADYLMDNHRNLNIVSPCVKKSKQFGKRDAQIADELCIALYVHIKGLIPIEEDPFPPTIEDFPTDVLEGGFKLFHGGPFNYHEQLKMGLAIHTNVTDNNGDRLFGTLGGFLDYPSVGMCALTCAHVVLTTDEMQQLIPCNQMNFKERDKQVFQSLDVEVQAFGQVILAFYRTGECTGERTGERK